MALLDLSTFLIKEHAGVFKLTDRYDIFDPQTNEKVGFAEEQPGAVVTYLRLLVNKQLMPTKVVVTDAEGDEILFTIRRGVGFLRTKVTVHNGDGEPLGYFKSKVLSLGGGFLLYDNSDKQVGEVKGDWKGWNFKLLSASGEELGTVAKKWAGVAKELFTSADNYIVSFAPQVSSNAALATLLLAAGLAIDTVFKEAE
ncbi:MAG: phospholipid scramblase-related protein [Planctomycetaceae bacterium]|nr:phospholipid scramblase-related protein [Planctomycetaceae bacterium]